jgi:hypothetical protein
MKVIVDYTATPLSMLPHQMGGAYWLSNVTFTHVFMMVAVYLYVSFYDENKGDKFDASTLWKVAAALTTTSALVFGYVRVTERSVG